MRKCALLEPERKCTGLLSALNLANQCEDRRGRPLYRPSMVVAFWSDSHSACKPSLACKLSTRITTSDIGLLYKCVNIVLYKSVADLWPEARMVAPIAHRRMGRRENRPAVGCNNRQVQKAGRTTAPWTVEEATHLPYLSRKSQL